jgi:hypothetical protein
MAVTHGSQSRDRAGRQRIAIEVDALELVSASLRLRDRSEARIERLYVKGENREEIRFSWWKDGKITPRPLDLPEAKLIQLIRKGIACGVLSDAFVDAVSKNSKTA